MIEIMPQMMRYAGMDEKVAEVQLHVVERVAEVAVLVRLEVVLVREALTLRVPVGSTQQNWRRARALLQGRSQLLAAEPPSPTSGPRSPVPRLEIYS